MLLIRLRIDPNSVPLRDVPSRGRSDRGLSDRGSTHGIMRLSSYSQSCAHNLLGLREFSSRVERSLSKHLRWSESMRANQRSSRRMREAESSEWSGGAQLSDRHVAIEPRLDSSVSAVLAGVPTGESISRSAFSGEAVCEDDVTEVSGVFEGLLGQAGSHKPSRFRAGRSNRIRESNRLNTAQLVARAGLMSTKRFWVAVGAVTSLAAMVFWKIQS